MAAHGALSGLRSGAVFLPGGSYALPGLVIWRSIRALRRPAQAGAAGQSLRLLLRLRQLADDRLAPRIPFR